MGLLNSLFGGHGQIRVDELIERVGVFKDAGKLQEAIRLTSAFRKAADKDRRIDENERLYQCGVAHFLALEPLLGIAARATPDELHAALRAFFATYKALHMTLGPAARAQPRNTEKLTVMGTYFDRSADIYKRAYTDYGDLVAEAADLEANEMMNNALRPYR